MNQATQEYMRDHFPAPGELIYQIPDHIKIVDSNTFRNLESEIDINDINLDDTTSIYSENSSEILINADANQSPEQLYATLFREGTRYVSINNGAGYHVYASQRLAPYLMAEKLTSNQTSKPHRSIFTPAYA